MDGSNGILARFYNLHVSRFSIRPYLVRVVQKEEEKDRSFFFGLGLLALVHILQISLSLS